MAQKFTLLFLLLFNVVLSTNSTNAGEQLNSTTTAEVPTTAIENDTTPSPADGTAVVPTTSETGVVSNATIPSPTDETDVVSNSTIPSPTDETDVVSTTATPTPTNETDAVSTTKTPTPTDATAAETTITTVSDPCASNPCGTGSTCDPRHNQTYVCLCLAGDFYNKISQRCESAKVFPGALDLPRLEYNEKMKDKTSKEFLNASQQINGELERVFSLREDYTGSTVLELQPIKKGKYWSWEKAANPGVIATVEIIFAPSAVITAESVKQAIEAESSCTDCLLNGTLFEESNLCDSQPCDKTTTTCVPEDGGFSCNCSSGYIPSDFSTRICVACPSGQQASGIKCIHCSFGYSGLNCNESWQLILVIVGTVLGALLLIALILLPVVALKLPKKKSSKSKDADMGRSYVNDLPTKAPLGNNYLASNQAPSVNGGLANSQASFAGNAGVPKIPRATTSSWDSRNNLEMTPSHSRQSLIAGNRNQLYEEPDDNSYAQSRPQSNLFGQARPQSNLYAASRPQSNNPYAASRPQSNNQYAASRPQSNPYAASRPQSNPYASGQGQGQTNPYYTHDDGRRFN